MNTNDFDIDIAELTTKYASSIFKVRISNSYFDDLDVLRKLTYKERRKLVRQKNRDSFKEIVQLLPNTNYELVGTKLKPVALIIDMSGQQLHLLSKSLNMGYLTIIEGNGLKKKEKKREKRYYSVQGQFAVKVEGFDYFNSIRLVEDRIILLKAYDTNEAEDIAMKEFEEYSKFEYLNSDFRLVRMEFIKISDLYEVDESEIEEMGTEIFSTMYKKKL